MMGIHGLGCQGKRVGLPNKLRSTKLVDVEDFSPKPPSSLKKKSISS